MTIEEMAQKAGFHLEHPYDYPTNSNYYWTCSLAELDELKRLIQEDILAYRDRMVGDC